MSTLDDRILNPPDETLRSNSPAGSDAASGRCTGATVSRLFTACLFWLLCLTLTAAGHRLYKATVGIDRLVSAERYQSRGTPAIWVGHGTLSSAWSRLELPPSAGEQIALFSLPNTPFWLGAGICFACLGGLMAWSGQWIPNNGLQSLVGLFAGHFLWLGAIELGLDAVGRRLGLAGALDVVEGRVAGTHASGVLIQMSGLFLVPVLLGLTLHESNRCAVFHWFRQRLPLVKTAAPSGRVDNYAARTALQYFMTVWFCYVAVLWLADSRLGELSKPALLLTMVLIFIATPYMIWRTANRTARSHALRYSVSGAVITWTAIEIAAALGYFEEPWLNRSSGSAIVLLGLTALLTGAVAGVLHSGRAWSWFSPRAVTFTVAGLMFSVVGCNAADELGAADEYPVSQTLQAYDARIHPPDTGAEEGLLRALCSRDAQMRAQAAIAFSKMAGVNVTVRNQLESMAASDPSPLSRFAALLSLQRLKLLSPEHEQQIADLRSDSEWDAVIEQMAP